MKPRSEPLGKLIFFFNTATEPVDVGSPLASSLPAVGSPSENEDVDEISMEEVEKAVERGNIYIDM